MFPHFFSWFFSIFCFILLILGGCFCLIFSIFPDFSRFFQIFPDFSWFFPWFKSIFVDYDFIYLEYFTVFLDILDFFSLILIFLISFHLVSHFSWSTLNALPSFTGFFFDFYFCHFLAIFLIYVAMASGFPLDLFSLHALPSFTEFYRVFLDWSHFLLIPFRFLFIFTVFFLLEFVIFHQIPSLF